MDSRYKQEVQKYGKKDAAIALCIFAALVALSIVDWALATHIPSFISIARIIIIGTIFIIVLVKKQGLASIGFHKDKLWPTLRFGILLILIFSAFGVVPGLIYGWELNSLGTVIPFLFTTLIMAAGEDIFFVGYLQTRLYGLFKKDVPAIFAGAVLFALAHVPVGLLSPFPSGWVTMWIIWIMAHVTLVLIFRRYFSIIPVIIAHTLANFFTGGGLWVEYNDWAGTAVLLILVILVVFEIARYRRAKKTSGEKTQ